jgi:aspartyl-tRNA(Asn)/glutamyl-tRNA(Gln) amidotransferase subunit B
VADGTLSRAMAQDVLAECLEEPKRPKQVVEERGLAQVSDTGELGRVVDEVLAANPDDVEAFRTGDDKARKKKRSFLAGEVMKATNRTANMKLVNQILDEKLS